MNGQPKPGFYFVVLLVILSLVGYGLYRLKTPSGSDTPPVVVDAVDRRTRIDQRLGNRDIVGADRPLQRRFTHC